MIIRCPLCDDASVNSESEAAGRELLRCNRCELLFVLPEHFLSSEEERERYLLHENDMGNVGYRDFLSQLRDPLIPLLSPGCLGLDYGCGPNPVLAALFAEKGFIVDCYDPYFFRVPPRGPYEFIALSEVVEHLFEPRKTLTEVSDLLKPNGFLAIMTESPPKAKPIAEWRYARDPTHVCFYSTKTFEIIANLLSMKIAHRSPRICILQKVSSRHEYA